MRRYSVKPRFYIFVCLVMLVFFGISFGVSWMRLAAEEDALAETQSRRAALSAEIAGIQDELEYAGTQDYIERSARDKLGMLYPGEYRYVGN
jgi:cell division protein DivIC